MTTFESFMAWVARYADAHGISAEQVGADAGIPTRRWNILMKGGAYPEEPEAEAVATEAFGLWPQEAWTCPDRGLATSFRQYFNVFAPREGYRFPSLWTRVLVRVHRIDKQQEEDYTDIFRAVLAEDHSENVAASPDE